MSTLDKAALLHLVQTLFPYARLRRAWPLSGGISAGMTALEIELPSGETRKIVLRQPGAAALQHNPRIAEEEYGVLQATHILGLATPAPLFYDPSGQIFPSPYLVIDYVEGQPEMAPQDLARFIHQAAEHLARIHRADVSQVDLSFLPYGIQDLVEILSGHPSQLDPSLGEDRIRAVLETAWPIPRRGPPALLHGDYWPGNLLWQDGQLSAVVDWEDAALGDPLADMAIARLDIAYIFGREAMHAFTEHYFAQNPIDATLLPAWDLCAALRLIRLSQSNFANWAAFFHPYGRTDITEGTVREQFVFFVEQALKWYNSSPWQDLI